MELSYRHGGGCPPKRLALTPRTDALDPSAPPTLPPQPTQREAKSSAPRNQSKLGAVESTDEPARKTAAHEPIGLLNGNDWNIALSHCAGVKKEGGRPPTLRALKRYVSVYSARLGDIGVLFCRKWGRLSGAQIRYPIRVARKNRADMGCIFGFLQFGIFALPQERRRHIRITNRPRIDYRERRMSRIPGRLP